MSRLKISPNLFLEVNELEHLFKFLEQDGYKSYFKYLCKSFGIAQNENNTFFKVSRKNEAADVVIMNSGIAFDSDLNRICLLENKELTIPNTGKPQWIVISYISTNDEEGTVNVSAQGALSGNGTKFLSVLRGQPNFPTKVKFNSSKNTEEYEVVDVTSDTIATLTGSLSAESGLKYQVIGTFTPGFQPDDEDKMIYEYDSCHIDIIESEDRPEVNKDQFIVACLTFVNGIVSISDERIRNLFNYEAKIDDDINTNTLQSNPFVALRQTTIRNGLMLDVQFEWGYEVTRFEVINTAEQNIFNILSGNSKYLATNRLPDGIFANWLLVNRKNMISVVIDNNNGNSLYISKLNPLLVTNEGDDEFVVVPNVKDIEVEVTLGNITSTNTKTITSDETLAVQSRANTFVSSSLGNITQWVKPNASLSDLTLVWGDKVTADDLKFDLSHNVIIGTIDKTKFDEDKLVSVLNKIDYGDAKYFFKFSIENAKSRFCFPLDYGQTLIKLRYRIMTTSETTKFQNFANSQFKNIKGAQETLGDSSFIVIVNKPEAEKRNYS